MKITALLTTRVTPKVLNNLLFQAEQTSPTASHQRQLNFIQKSWSRSLSSFNEKQEISSSSKYSLTTVISGFPKTQRNSRFNRNLDGQVGEDAYFISRYESEQNLDNKTSSEQDNSLSINSADVVGVADGVGGWKLYGIDPSRFSRQLMKNCEQLVKSGQFDSTKPTGLLSNAYYDMKKAKEQNIFGSSTACLTMVGHNCGIMYTANMGDSGLLVVREGVLVHITEEQTHCFNTPYQLSLPPPEHMQPGTLIDSPNDADVYKFQVQNGDIILLGTDGLFDNVDINIILKIINRLNSQKIDIGILQKCCDAIAITAQELSRNETFMSPFAKNAMYHGYKDMFGGKEDDITVLLSVVNMADIQNSNEE